jgi:hypothetical protein
MSRPMRLIARVVSPAEAVADCQRSAAACVPVLRCYGIENVTSAHQEWWADPDTHAVLLTERDTGAPVGGVRLQRWGGRLRLPIESAVGPIDPRVHAWIAGFGALGVGELCGLWRAPRLRGFGIGARLTCMAIALATLARTRTLIGLCDTRSLEANARLGLRPDPTVGANGRFAYPRATLVAHVLRDPDAFRLSNARPDARDVILAYRYRPIGREVLCGPRGTLELERDLRGEPEAPRADQRATSHPALARGIR